MTRQTKCFGYRPDLGDPRDHMFTAPHFATGLPPSVDLRSKLPPVWDQGQLGSCTAFALTGAVAFLHDGFEGSQLWLYWNERKLEGTVKQDAGAEIRDGIKVLAKLGLPPEADWPYLITKFAQTPTAKANRDAKADLIGSYKRLGGEADYRACLAAGSPFVVGISVFDSFESEATAKHGDVPMPGAHDAPIGGHAILIVGYRTDGRYIFRNSWGADWGTTGYGTLPRAYLADANLATDAWAIAK